MLLKYFYDEKLAQASYMVGCQRAKEAISVDPGREPEQLGEAAQMLHKIGVEDIAGAFDSAVVISKSLATEVYLSRTPDELSRSIEAGEVKLLDVRSDEEWNAGHVEQAEHRFLGRLPSHLDELPRDQMLVVQCQAGARSAIAVSVLQSAGFKHVVNLMGGYAAWKSRGLPSVTPQPAMSY